MHPLIESSTRRVVPINHSYHHHHHHRRRRRRCCCCIVANVVVVVVVALFLLIPTTIINTKPISCFVFQYRYATTNRINQQQRQQQEQLTRLSLTFSSVTTERKIYRQCRNYNRHPHHNNCIHVDAFTTMQYTYIGKSQQRSTIIHPNTETTRLLMQQKEEVNHDDDIYFDNYNSNTTDIDSTIARTTHTRTTNSNTSISSTSTGQRIMDFAIPAAAALLIDPLMTLVDTAFVGRFPPHSGSTGLLSSASTTTTTTTTAAAAAAPLAGMGSAMALLTFAFYIFNFLCTTTTPLIAQQRSSGNTTTAITIGGQVLSLSLVMGCTLTAVLLLFRQPLLIWMGTGNTGMDANHYAMSFLSIRALAAPAILCIEASTGIFRGFLDTQTPVVVLVLANLLNFILDIVLIVGYGMGPTGAAIATTTAEWISASTYLAILAGFVPSASKFLGKQNTNSSISSMDEEVDLDKDGTTIAPPPVSIVPVWTILSWEDIRPLFVASSSAFFRAIVLQISLSSAATMAARGGTGWWEDTTITSTTIVTTAASTVAAHQIGIQLWLFCSFFCDSLAAASQGLIADALGRQDSDDVLDITKTIFVYSLCLGLVLAVILLFGTWTTILLNLFTQDVATIEALKGILPLIILAQPLNALVFAADGILQGASEFPFQAKAMFLSGVTAASTFFILEAAGRYGSTDTLVHIWSALLALQLMRGLTSLWKLLDQNGPINLLSKSNR